MTLVNRVLNRLPETKDDLHKDMKTWVDNMDETAWYYLAVHQQPLLQEQDQHQVRAVDRAARHPRLERAGKVSHSGER